MTTQLSLFDRSALERHRYRADADALFLHMAAIDEVKDRLSLVNRSFTRPAIVTPFADLWRPLFPDAVIVNDDEFLLLEPSCHDLVIHAMCLHWANDPVGQLIQCRRALINDGLMLAILLGGQTLAELRAVLSQAESRISGGLSPRVSPMAEIRDLGGILNRAGFALPVADATTITAAYRDLWHLMRDLRAMGETNALTGRLRQTTRRAVFELADRLYREQYGQSSGGIAAGYELICLTGWAPDESQPKPLRPGSAQERLANALGSVETKLPD